MKNIVVVINKTRCAMKTVVDNAPNLNTDNPNRFRALSIAIKEKNGTVSGVQIMPSMLQWL